MIQYRRPLHHTDSRQPNLTAAEVRTVWNVETWPAGPCAVHLNFMLVVGVGVGVTHGWETTSFTANG